MKKQVAALATDEEHIVMWDIDSLLADIVDFPYVRIPVSKLIPNEWLTIDTQYAQTTDVSKPIVLFVLPNNKGYIADGNHRLYRAVTEDIPEMNVMIIPEEMHLQYLFRCSEKDYYAVVSNLMDEGIFIDYPL